MTVVVGFGPDVRSTAGLQLAGQLARAADAPLVLCCVVHDAFDTPLLRDAHSVDDEWRKFLDSSARDAVSTARAALPDDIRSTTVVRTGRSVPEVLRQEGKIRDAELLVAGSGGVGSHGRVSLGSTTDRLVHSSSIPVALAPRGYQDEGPPRRILLAVEPTLGDISLAGPVADMAQRFGLEVTVATFLVRQRSAMAAFSEYGVLRAWREAVAESHGEIETALVDRGVTVAGTKVFEGETWSAALRRPDWRPGDLLVVGSSKHGPVARVFLGSTAARILRHSPAPTIVLPR